MKKGALNRRIRRALQGRSRGFSLIEVTIAIALIGVIAVAIFGALSYSSTVLIIADRRATAESLAKSQMEYVKNQPYIDYRLSERDPREYDKIVVDEYGVVVDVQPIEPVTHDPYRLKEGEQDVFRDDKGIQKITVTVTYNILRYNVSTQGSEEVPESFTLDGYKRKL
jgi:prepilin-type N-terminal cleavage/methylation domain-containing protein